MKFVFGVAVGYFLFHPVKEDSKFDQAIIKGLQKGGYKAGEFLTKKLIKVTEK